MRRLLATLIVTGLLLHCAAPPPPSRVTPTRARRVVRGGVSYAIPAIPPAVLEGRVCGDDLRDEEWYSVDLTEASRLILRLDISGNESDLDLALYDDRASRSPFDMRTLKQSASVRSNESIEEDLQPGRYYIRVYCYTAHGPTNFTLNITSIATVKPPPVKPQPVDELKSHAITIQRMGRATIGYDHTYRSRWYRYDVVHAGTLTVTVESKTTNGSLLFDILDGDPRSMNRLNPTHIKVDVARGPLYFHLQTTSPQAVVQYEFHVEVTPRPAPSPPPRSTKPSHITVAKPWPVSSPPEPPRSSATPLGRAKSAHGQSWSSSAQVVLGGSTQPPAKWYTFTIKKKSSATISYSGAGHIEIYPRGGSKPLNGRGKSARSLSDIELQRGDYDVRIVGGTSQTEGTISISVNESDDTSGFVKKPH